MSAVEASRVRGGEAVKAALVEAAAQMLGEVGPRGISVRDLADRAGVNHGQVHHYFGGKRPLLEAAMRYLARGHYEHSRELAGDAAVPPALSLAEDADYWRAICQVVMDGDLELAGIEIDAGISVPRNVLRALQEKYPDADELDLKARFASMAAAQLGWVAFEDFMMLVADVEPDQRAEVRERARHVMQRAIDEALGSSSAHGPSKRG